MTSQSHFTLSFPLKSPADAKAIAEQLPLMMPALFQAEDSIGTIHYSRFTLLSDKTLLFLGDFDGEFGTLMTELAKHAGPVFDAIFPHVDNPPPTPVADNAEAFVEWLAAHPLHPVNLYTAYPEVTAKEIKALAAAADVSGGGELNLIPGDLADEIETCFHGGATDPARKGTWNDEGSGQSRDTALCAVRSAGGQPDWLFHCL